MGSGFVIGLMGLVGAVIGSVVGGFHSIKKARWWLPHVFIFFFVLYCLFYGFCANSHLHYGPEGMLPVFGLAIVGSVILSLGWLAGWVWLLCHKDWKKAGISFGLWLLVGGLQMFSFVASLVFGSFQYFFWLPFPPV